MATTPGTCSSKHTVYWAMGHHAFMVSVPVGSKSEPYSRRTETSRL